MDKMGTIKAAPSEWLEEFHWDWQCRLITRKPDFPTPTELNTKGRATRFFKEVVNLP